MVLLDRDKLLAELQCARLRHIAEQQDFDSLEEDERIHFAAECTIDNVIELIASGDYTINEEDK